jgi:tetratricopeptide (TPR) repeat protein
MSMKRGHAICLCLALAVLVGSSFDGVLLASRGVLALGQAPPRPPRLDYVEQWLTAIEQHAPGAQDEALRSVTSWNRDDLSGILFHVGALVALVRNPEAVVNFQRVRGTTNSVYTMRELKRLQELGQRARGLGDRWLLVRGVLLHTDAAVLGGGEEGRSGRRANMWSARVFVQTNDGQQTGSHELAGHLEAARALLSHLPTKPSPDELIRRWYRATTAYLQREVQLDQSHIEAALFLFPKDPELLLLAGALHETFAGAPMQQVVESSALPFGMTLGIESSKKELRRAEELFRRTLKIDAQHIESRVRLGNVLGQLGRHKDAAVELQQTLKAANADPELAYFARMFFAREAEQLGQIAQARASYEHAVRLYPRAQSPLLALSQLALRTGDNSASQSLLQRVFSSSGAPNQGDPRWRYPSYAGRAADRLLAEARTALIAAGSQ